ncbi:10076_t:CDS:2, partial [Gigaspora rosea]
ETHFESKCMLMSKNLTKTKIIEAPTGRSSKVNKSHNIVNQHVKDKKTQNDKSDLLDDVRNLFESVHGHQNSVGIKKNEHEVPNNNQ